MATFTSTKVWSTQSKTAVSNMALAVFTTTQPVSRNVLGGWELKNS